MIHAYCWQSAFPFRWPARNTGGDKGIKSVISERLKKDCIREFMHEQAHSFPENKPMKLGDR